MEMYYENIQQLIGNTPLVKLNHIDIPEKVQLFAKLEYWNPSGSVKDRTGIYMLQDAERKGILVPGGTIVEATAGNTGLGIAMAALNKGYEIIFVVPTKFSQEKQALLKALGATILNTPREKGMRGAEEKAIELCKEIPNAISLKQFQNPSNPLAHYETTGKEIYDDLEGHLDYFIGGAGSGGTYSGVVKYLKEKNPKIKGILADPIGSTIGGGEHADYDIEGIGNDFIAATMDMNLVDEVIKISDTEAYEGARLLARKEGMFVGASSGAALAGAVRLANNIGEGRIVTLFPDRGDRYFSKNLYANV
ncbi:PLP-dependent cysteine synthase family protein [Anaerocolumna jejuensis]|uniref:PLP-dependent cysteine synthase family protein n=1 Tax=Anaerocolumna jejuensis TaxID=259063 RepID=UPI003F7C6087